jgi:hypothetical protein
MIRGHIPCTWDQQKIKALDYIPYGYTPDCHVNLTDPADLDRYIVSFSLIRDLDFDDYPWINENFTWLKNKHFQINLFKPGEVGPLHTDVYPYYTDLYQCEDAELFRVIVFLEDWKNGHYFELENNGITNYVAGDWIGWNLLNTPHLVANLGTENRYTLQLTGVRTDV